MRRIAAMLAVTVLVCSCETTPTLPDGSAKPVIEAFLFAGESVTDVHIATTVALGSADTVGTPINDAVVVLTKLGIRYTLTPAEGDSGYYRYLGEDLSVNEGDVFDLEVTYAGSVATAQTVVPIHPDTVTLSADSIVVPTFGRGSGGTPGAFGTQLIARWPNPSRDLYYVTIEAVGDSSSPITSGFGGARRFIFPPIAADSFAVSPVSLAYYGLHRVKVYHVNTEYAALYESRQQDTRDLNEPATNVRNGLGVFSAFSSRSVTFRAVAAQ
jgi:hypothetical protein